MLFNNSARGSVTLLLPSKLFFCKQSQLKNEAWKYATIIYRKSENQFLQDLIIKHLNNLLSVQNSKMALKKKTKISQHRVCCMLYV